MEGHLDQSVTEYAPERASWIGNGDPRPRRSCRVSDRRGEGPSQVSRASKTWQARLLFSAAHLLHHLFALLCPDLLELRVLLGGEDRLHLGIDIFASLAITSCLSGSSAGTACAYCASSGSTSNIATNQIWAFTCCFMSLLIQDVAPPETAIRAFRFGGGQHVRRDLRAL